MKQSFFQFIVVSAIAFVLHLVWENMQCSQFIHINSPPSQLAMIVASLGDVALTWLAFLGVAVVSRDLKWYSNENWATIQIICIQAEAVAISIFVEYFALQTNRWSYTDSNPLIPGLDISILPVLQLMILLPVTFILARFTIRKVFRQN